MRKEAGITVEYAMVAIVLIAALVGMAVYMKRAISGKWRQGVDSTFFGRQYAPKYK